MRPSLLSRLVARSDVEPSPSHAFVVQPCAARKAAARNAPLWVGANTRRCGLTSICRGGSGRATEIRNTQSKRYVCDKNGRPFNFVKYCRGKVGTAGHTLTIRIRGVTRRALRVRWALPAPGTSAFSVKAVLPLSAHLRPLCAQAVL